MLNKHCCRVVFTAVPEGCSARLMGNCVTQPIYWSDVGAHVVLETLRRVTIGPPLTLSCTAPRPVSFGQAVILFVVVVRVLYRCLMVALPLQLGSWTCSFIVSKVQAPWSAPSSKSSICQSGGARHLTISNRTTTDGVLNSELDKPLSCAHSG